LLARHRRSQIPDLEDCPSRNRSEHVGAALTDAVQIDHRGRARRIGQPWRRSAPEELRTKTENRLVRIIDPFGLDLGRC